jgi:hypothetical protein
MKRIILTVLIAGLLISTPVLGQDDLTGKMFAGGYLGYGFGLGDAFPGDVDAGFGFGGTFHYGLNERMMIGGELGFQNYDSGTESELETNILFNGLYAFNYTRETGFYLTFGGGFYGGNDTNFGINGGIVYSKLISETISLYGMPRLHIIFADETPMILQLAVGIHIPIGASTY